MINTSVSKVTIERQHAIMVKTAGSAADHLGLNLGYLQLYDLGQTAYFVTFTLICKLGIIILPKGLL